MKPTPPPHAWIAVCLAACVSLATTASAASSPVAVFSGMCDASAIVMLDERRFLAANDEDNILRVYDRTRPGPPERLIDLGSFLNGADPAEESDMEGAARLGSRVYWITSHGANKKGRTRLARRRLFAVELGGKPLGVLPKPVGRPYVTLVEDLMRDPRMDPLQLARAATRPPKEAGALNIEGLCPTPEGGLLIGLRNPVPGGRAWLIPLLNPNEVVADDRARFGDPIRLDLGGLGIRSLDWHGDTYLIVAGPVDGGAPSLLYTWDGPGISPQLLSTDGLPDLNPEAIAVYDDAPLPRLWVVSDDGARQVDSKDCKDVKDPARQQFRAQSVAWFPRPATASAGIDPRSQLNPLTPHPTLP